MIIENIIVYIAETVLGAEQTEIWLLIGQILAELVRIFGF